MTTATSMLELAYVHWDVSPKLVLGPLKFHYYGMLFACGIMFAYATLRWLYEREGDDGRDAVKLAVALVVGLFIGARLVHIIFYDDVGSYLADPLLVFNLKRGGLASHGGAVGVMLVTWFWARRVRGVPYMVIFDRVTVAALVVSPFVRLGNLMNSEIYGRATDVPWAFVFMRAKAPDPAAIPAGLSEAALAYLPEQIPRHPSQLYAVLMHLSALAILLLVARWYAKRDRRRPLGLLAGLMLVLYNGARMGIELTKEYLVFSPGEVTMGQWLSLPLVILGSCWIWAALWGPWRERSYVDYVGTTSDEADPAAAGVRAEVKAATASKPKRRRKR